MKRLLLTLIAFAFVMIGISQTWEKYDGSIVELNPDLTLRDQPVDSKWVVVSPFLYTSQEVLSVDIDGATLVVTHKGLIKRFEWKDVVIYRKIYGIVAGKMKLIKVVDGKYTAPVTIPEKREFKKAIEII